MHPRTLAVCALSMTIALGAAASVACSACSSGNSGSPGGDASADVAHDVTTSETGSSSGGHEGGATDGGGGEGGSDGGIDRGPTTLNIDPSGNAHPESVWWDDAKQLLFIADNRNNQIWSWSDKSGFAKLATTFDDPNADDAGRTDVGQIVELADGTLVVPRFGFGKYGAMLVVSPDGGASEAPNVSATLKHLGLTVDSNGKLWSGDFAANAVGGGSVQKVDLATGETLYAGGFGKVVGVLAVGGQILVSDQTQGLIFAVPANGAVGDGGLADGAAYPVYANVPSPDMLAAGPNGTVFTDQHLPLADGGPLQIRQIWPDGGVAVFAGADGGLTQPSGVAYDPTNKRLFVADSNGTTVRTIKIYPVN